MRKKPPHTILLNETARRILTPLGLKMHESRLWIDDNRWWLICIEFESSRWSKGSYLNVGCSWLLYPKDYISFDEGHRQHPFIPFENKNQFQDAVEKLCHLAVDKVKEFRKKYQTINDVLSGINEKIDDQGRRKGPFFDIRRYGPWFRKRRFDIWATYYSAILFGLLGNVKESDNLLKIIIEAEAQFDWWDGIQKIAKSCREAVHDPIKFKILISDFVNQHRTKLKLIPIKETFDELR